MSKAQTLADQIIHQYSRNRARSVDSAGWITRMVSEARKFVLDESMSAFSADLAYSFLPRVTKNVKRVHGLLEGVRTQARLPHKCMWIEFDMHARVRRAAEAYSAGTIDVEPLVAGRSPKQGAWLLLQDRNTDYAFIAVECVSHTRRTEWAPGQLDTEPLVYNPTMSPLAYVWTVNDLVPPWPLAGSWNNKASAVLTGVSSYRIPQVAWTMSPWVNSGDIPKFLDYDFLRDLAFQLSSDIRYLWALLAAINDVPVVTATVTPTRGHMVGRNYKKFSEHTIVTLKVPHRVNLQRVAKQALVAARRRAHQVRGHMRKDWREPLVAQCSHLFEPVPDTHLIRCKQCGGRKMWIPEHQRGDASLGFVLHDYKVEHPKP